MDDCEARAKIAKELSDLVLRYKDAFNTRPDGRRHVANAANIYELGLHVRRIDI